MRDLLLSYRPSVSAKGGDGGRTLDTGDVDGLLALLSLGDVELHPLTLGEAFEAIHGDGAEMNEDILALIGGDKTVALCIVEPFDRSLKTQDSSPYTENKVWRGAVQRDYTSL